MLREAGPPALSVISHTPSANIVRELYLQDVLSSAVKLNHLHMQILCRCHFKAFQAVNLLVSEREPL